MNREKQVQIPQKVLISLIRYFLIKKTEEDEKAITEALENKLEAMIRHDLYTKSKIAETDEEREKARQEYLDRIGMHKDFRW